MPHLANITIFPLNHSHIIRLHPLRSLSYSVHACFSCISAPRGFPSDPHSLRFWAGFLSILLERSESLSSVVHDEAEEILHALSIWHRSKDTWDGRYRRRRRLGSLIIMMFCLYAFLGARKYEYEVLLTEPKASDVKLNSCWLPFFSSMHIYFLGID